MKFLKNNYTKGQWFIARPVSNEIMKSFIEAGFLRPYYCSNRDIPEKDDYESGCDHRYYFIYSQHRILSTTPSICCQTTVGTFDDILSEMVQEKFDNERD